MNVRTLCLAILHEGDASGYEIRKLCTEGDCSYFVEASFGAIYPALAKLEEEQLVSSHVEAHQGRPSKKVYAITDKGRRAFLDSLFEPLGEDVFRSEFLLFARFAQYLPANLVEARLEERLAKLDAEMVQLGELLENRSHAADAWVIRYGLDCLKGARDYIDNHKHELIAMAQPDAASEAAAE